MPTLPPGSRGLPVVRHNIGFVRGPVTWNQQQRDAHGRLFRAHLFGSDVVFLTTAESVEQALRAEGETFENEWLGNVNRILGEGCTARLTGAAHKRRRRLLAPYFSARGLDALIPTLSDAVDRHLAEWADAGEIVLVDRFRALTFEVIARYALGDPEALGIDLDALSDDFTTMVEGLFSLPVDLPFTRLGRGRAAVQRLHAEMIRAAGLRRAEPLGSDALSALLQVRDEDGSPLPDADIAAELVLLLFAGHETTVTSMTNLLLLLAEHPEALAALEAEQDTHHSEPPSMAAFRRRPWTQACINESMRRYSPIAGSFRRVKKDTEIGGYHIPAGWMVGVSYPPVHLDPDVYAAPEAFDPGRFLPPREEHLAHKGAFVPFGGGPRTCLGKHMALLEMQLMTRAIALHYTWTVLPGQNLTRRQLPTPLPVSGGRVRFSRRTRA